MNYQEWKLSTHITSNFANLTFDQLGKVEMLLGRDIFFEILQNEVKFQPNSGLVYIVSTRLGWIVSGYFQTNKNYIEKWFFHKC